DAPRRRDARLSRYAVEHVLLRHQGPPAWSGGLDTGRFLGWRCIPLALQGEVIPPCDLVPMPAQESHRASPGWLPFHTRPHLPLTWPWWPMSRPPLSDLARLLVWSPTRGPRASFFSGPTRWRLYVCLRKPKPVRGLGDSRQPLSQASPPCLDVPA